MLSSLLTYSEEKIFMLVEIILEGIRPRKIYEEAIKF